MAVRERSTGRLINVWEPQVGTTLAADASAGATSITVDDPSCFDEAGGSLYIGSQVVKYSTFDDETGVVTFAGTATLTEAAATDDPVYRWSTLYNDVETVQKAEVAVEGDRDQADTLHVEVADTVTYLANGDRGLDGENCTIERDGDVWRLISAHGRPSKARGVKFETDDAYTITDADVTAGTVTFSLSQQPITESLKLWWRTTFQPPTEYTVNESAQTVTMTLGSFVAAGDRIFVHYAYRRGLGPAGVSPVVFSVVGYTVEYGFTATSIAWPSGTADGDLFVYASLNRTSQTNACGDSRATLWVEQPLASPNGVSNTVKIWRGTVSTTGTPLAINTVFAGGFQDNPRGILVIRPERATDWAPTKTSDSGECAPATGSIPGLSDVSGAVGVGFTAGSLGGGSQEPGWASPWAAAWTGAVTNGTNAKVTFSTQVSQTVAPSTTLVASAASPVTRWRGFALGVKLA